MLVVKCGRILLTDCSEKDDGRLECTFERTLSNEFSRTPTYFVGKQTTFTCRLKKVVTGWLKDQCHFHFNWVILIEAIMAGTNSLKRFLKKKLLVQRNTKINVKRDGLVTLPWRLRLQ